MKMDIDKKIINKTDRCKKNFECLKNKNHIYCKVKDRVGETAHFIECVDELNCNYKISFGFSYMCTCPTRKEIYNRYNI